MVARNYSGWSRRKLMTYTYSPDFQEAVRKPSRQTVIGPMFFVLPKTKLISPWSVNIAEKMWNKEDEYLRRYLLVFLHSILSVNVCRETADWVYARSFPLISLLIWPFSVSDFLSSTDSLLVPSLSISSVCSCVISLVLLFMRTARKSRNFHQFSHFHSQNLEMSARFT